MLEHYFTKATRLRQLRRGPLGPHIDGLAGEFRQAGYAATTASTLLSYAAKFSGFAGALGIADASQIDDALANRFLDDLAAEGAFTGAASAVHHMLEYLRRAGVIVRAAGAVHQDVLADLLDQYDVHLRDVQGLQPATRVGYIRAARKLLEWKSKRPDTQLIADLSRADVLTFVTEVLEPRDGVAQRSHICSETRVFLRYLGSAGSAASDLDRAVPRPRRYRLSTVPRHLPWEQVRTLINSVDTTDPWGMRDKAVLLLLATLGLRSTEVRCLELGHIAWRSGEIRLPRTKSCRERILPMPQELGAALADYILHGRPVIDVPQVFLRHKAPLGAMVTGTSVAAIVALHLRRAGLTPATRGARLLRHSLATRMVNVGVPIKTIADVLGHASIDTTAIYTKVDTTRLASAALPFPRGGDE